MERRFLLGVLLLLTLLACAIAAGIGMRAIHQPGEQALNRAVVLAQSGDLSQAVRLGNEAFQRWQTYRTVTAIFADHTPMDQTQTLFQEMQVYAHAGEGPHFTACCAQLAAMLRAMYETHSFSLGNIL